jgi:hypothetical protein
MKLLILLPQEHIQSLDCPKVCSEVARGPYCLGHSLKLVTDTRPHGNCNGEFYSPQFIEETTSVKKRHNFFFAYEANILTSIKR